MTADQIVKLLAEKHQKDVFVSECKDGSSWGNHLRMDAWAMARSWVHPCMYGYEVKVSRADFLGDNKWPGYLPLCNLFSFVAPRGIIQPSELSEGVGLLEVASTGTMLRTIRKSTYREIEPPSDLLKYILMCRAKVVGPRFHRMDEDEDEDEEDPAEFWREWLTKKQDMRDIGYQVSKRLAKLIAEQIDAVHCENVKLKAENENYSEIREMLKELGLTPGWWHTKDSLRDKAAEFKAGVPRDVREAILRAKVAIAQLAIHIGDEPSTATR